MYYFLKIKIELIKSLSNHCKPYIRVTQSILTFKNVFNIKLCVTVEVSYCLVRSTGANVTKQCRNKLPWKF
jgi:hypothetical protein